MKGHRPCWNMMSQLLKMLSIVGHFLCTKHSPFAAKKTIFIYSMATELTLLAGPIDN